MCPSEGDVVSRTPAAVSPHGETGPPHAAEEALHASELAQLSETALELLALGLNDNIYVHIAERLRKLIGGPCLVVLNSFDEKAAATQCRAVAGLDPRLAAAVVRVMGTHPVGTSNHITRDAFDRLRSGEIQYVPDLYEIFFREIPRPVTGALEKLIRITDIRAMGFVAGGQLFASAVVLLRRGHEFERPSLLRAFVNQAAVSLKRWQAEAALLASERRYRMITESVTDAIITADGDNGVIRDVNPRACEMLGHPRETLVGSRLTDRLGDPYRDRQDGSETARDVGTGAEHRRLTHPDGREILVEVRRGHLADGAVVAVVRDITQQREVERAVLDWTNRERREIGRNLHDVLGQQLAGINYLGSALAKSVHASSPDVADEALRIAEIARGAAAQAGRIARGLCPVDALELGLTTALTRLADDTHEIFGIDCRFTGDCDTSMWDTTVPTQLFLIAQEAATNAARHAQAREITITLGCGTDTGRLQIEDDGRGFTPGATHDRGMGLRIMEYRTGLISGTFSIDPTPGRGTRIWCDFPLRSGPSEPGRAPE